MCNRTGFRVRPVRVLVLGIHRCACLPSSWPPSSRCRRYHCRCWRRPLRMHARARREPAASHACLVEAMCRSSTPRHAVLILIGGSTAAGDGDQHPGLRRVRCARRHAPYRSPTRHGHLERRSLRCRGYIRYFPRYCIFETREQRGWSRRLRTGLGELGIAWPLRVLAWWVRSARPADSEGTRVLSNKPITPDDI